MVVTRRGIAIARSKRGFTIIEAMVAITIFAIAILAISAGMMIVLSSSMQTTEHARATALAVQKLEELKALPVDSIKSEAFQSVAADGTVGSGPYTRWVTVADSAGGPDMAGLFVYVRYPTGTLGDRTVKLETLMYTGSF